MLSDFFKGKNSGEITDRLVLIDKSIMDLHNNGFFVVGDLAEINVINDEITLASFKNKIDYLNSGYNESGVKKDIIELCSIGICAYYHFDTLYTSKDFISYLIDNLDMFLENGNIPKYMKEYYINVLLRGNVDYLNNFLLKYENNGKGNKKSRVYTKSTAVGRALSLEDAAYANVLIFPAIIVLIFLVILVSYMIFVR